MWCFTRRTLPVYLALAALFALATGATATEVVPRTMSDTVHDAGAIIRGHVVDAQSRWGSASHHWMMTDYSVVIDDVILGGGAIQKGATVKLSFWGGHIGSDTQFIAGLSLPQMGGSYVLMLRPDWQQPGTDFTPLMELDQGMFPLVTDPGTGKTIVTEAEGAEPLMMTASGQVVRSYELSPANKAKARAGVTSAAFLGWLQANLTRIKKLPTTPLPGIDPANVPIFSQYTQKAIPDAPWDPPTDLSALSVPVGLEGQAPAAPTPPEKPIKSSVNAKAVPGGGLQMNPNYSFFGLQNVYCVMNPLQSAGFYPYSPEDQYQMSNWNYYGDMFRVITSTGTFGWPNGRNDMDGFPDSATLNSVYGSGWGAGELAVTFSRQSGNTINEADVAFNPSVSWSFDEVSIFTGNAPNDWPWRRSCLHELGHVIGFNHQFNFLSVMNYPPHDYRVWAPPFMDDAEGIRAAYPGQAQGRNDLGVELFYSAGFQDWEEATHDTFAVAGNWIYINNFQVENVGTSTISNPSLQWYLTTSINYSDPYYYLGTVTYGSSLGRFTYFNPSTVGTSLYIPSYVPGGDYYINAYIPDDGLDFPFGNNYGWTHTRITVDPQLTGLSISPYVIHGGNATTGTIYLSSTAGPNGLWVYVSSNDNSTVPDPGWIYVPWGYSSWDFTIYTNAPTAPEAVTLTAGSDGYYQSYTLYLTVPTGLQVFNAAGKVGQTVNLSAVLTRPTDGAAIANEYVYFYIAGNYVGYGYTDGSGLATTSAVVPEPAGAADITAVFFGDYYIYEASSGSATLTATRATTTLSVASGGSGAIGQAVTLSATLTRNTDNAGVAGRTLKFYIGSRLVGTGTTDGGTGSAECRV